MEAELLTTEEVAEYLKVPVATVRKWRYEGTGPLGFRVGRHVRYPASSVLAWCAERGGQPQTAA